MALKKAVLFETDNLHTASKEQAAATIRKVELLFQLLPDYELSSASIPVVEFPYPPSRVATLGELKLYLVENIDRILQISKD